MADDNEALVGEDWSGEMGERWLANLERFEAMIAPIGDALLARADFKPGERVIDLGCGGGATTRAIGGAVAPEGEALGLDIAPMLVAKAQERAQGLAGVSFQCADAATATVKDAPYDRMFSRFGSMFFADPHSAFGNLHAMLKPGARLDLAVWGPPRENAWMMEMMGVVRQHVEVPPAEPRAPGPFAFEDLDYLGEILEAGGFKNMEVEPYVGMQVIGGNGTTPQDAVRFVLSSLGIGRVLDEQSDEVRAAASSDLEAMFAKRYVEGEGPMLGCKVWFVSAAA